MEDQKGESTERWRRRLTLFLLVCAVALFKGAPALHYSTWNMDEEQVVIRALGFLDYDFNPRWIAYHHLPMYLPAALYFVLWFFYSALGLVSSKAEFVSLLFSNDTVFYISARLLFCFAYTLGCWFLAKILWRDFQTRLGAVLFFLMAIFMPDAVMASTEVRVDTFVFLFVCLTIYSSCFSPKSAFTFVLSLLWCSAAFASKFPAIVLFPALFVKIAHDVYKGAYPKRYLAYFPLLAALFSFLLMPYVFLDVDLLRERFGTVFVWAKGARLHVGKAYHYGLGDKLLALFDLIVSQTGTIPILCAGVLAVRTIFKRKTPLFVLGQLRGGCAAHVGPPLAAGRELGDEQARALHELHPVTDPILFFPMAAVGLYAASFSASLAIDSHWLRPVYPFVLFFAVIFVEGVFSPERIRGLIGRLRVKGKHADKYPQWGRILALSLLAGAHVVFHHDGVALFARELAVTGEDTRALASDWMQRNIPEEATVVLDGWLPHYLPRVFSQDKLITLDNFCYNAIEIISGNRILTVGFDFHHNKHRDRHKRFMVTPRTNYMSRGYEADKIRIPNGAYVVISSLMYDRFYTDVVSRQHPGLAKNARAFYDSIRRQEHIKIFTGRGPTIEIYRMKTGTAEFGGGLHAEGDYGSVLLREGRTRDAIIYFRNAISSNPDSAAARNKLGVALARRGEDGEAIVHFERALRINPDFAQAHNNLGAVLFRGGETNKALFHFKEALRVKPDFAEAYNNFKKASSGHRDSDASPKTSDIGL